MLEELRDFNRSENPVVSLICIEDDRVHESPVLQTKGDLDHFSEVDRTSIGVRTLYMWSNTMLASSSMSSVLPLLRQVS